MGSCLLIRGRTLVDVRGLDADSLFFTEELAISGALCVRSATPWGGAGPVPVLRAWRHFLQGRYGGFDGT